MRSQGEGDNGGPGSAVIYIRGVVSGGDGNHSGSEPSVGMYLDEQPVTTITDALPLHMYDMSRVEVLEGPQGTLFGASSEAGKVRLITNKPDPTKFEAGYNVQGNDIEGGGPGDVVEGYVNLPITDSAAIRLVAWQEHDGGYISNVAGTDANACIFNGVRTFPTWALSASGVGPGGGTGQCAPSAPIGAGAITNAPWRKNDYNTVDTHGGRAELLFDLGDNWTITPTIQGESDNSEGFFGYDPAMGTFKRGAFRAGELPGRLAAERPHGRGQSPRLRHRLCRRLRQAQSAFGRRLQRLFRVLRQAEQLRRLLHRQQRQADHAAAVRDRRRRFRDVEPGAARHDPGR